MGGFPLHDAGHRGPVLRLVPELIVANSEGIWRLWELLHVDEEVLGGGDNGRCELVHLAASAADGASTQLLLCATLDQTLELVRHCDATELTAAAGATWECVRFGRARMALRPLAFPSFYLQCVAEKCALVCVPPSPTAEVPVFTFTMAFPPVVNVSSLLQSCDDADSSTLAAQHLMDACHDCGFFAMTGHGLGAAASIAASLQRDFERHVDSGGAGSHLSRCTKVTLRSSSGLVKTSFNPPVHEAIAHPAWISSNTVPHQLAEYFDTAAGVGRVLLEILAQRDFNVETEIYSLLRAVCFPPAEQQQQQQQQQLDVPEDVGVQLDVHTDKSWLTILAATDISGLEFLDGDGETYTRVALPPLDESVPLLVNVGDALQMHSGGVLPSRPHRANNRSGSVARVSLPLFIEPHPDHWPRPYTTSDVVVMTNL